MEWYGETRARFLDDRSLASTLRSEHLVWLCACQLVLESVSTWRAELLACGLQLYTSDTGGRVTRVAG